MSAATSSRPTAQKPRNVGLCGVSGAAVFFAGVLLCYDTDGYLVNGADTAGLRFAGVAREDVDNTTGADDALDATFYREGTFKFASTGLTAADVGKRVYVIDNQTVGIRDHASVDQGIYVGVITEVVSATACYVDIQPGNELGRPGDGEPNVEILAAAETLLATCAELQKLDANGAHRDVTLPPEPSCKGKRILIHNTASAAFNLVVKDDSPATIVTLNQNEGAWLFCDGVAWKHGGVMTLALT